MFFPERIQSIRTGDNVLEVGPGGSPHPRANVLLEKRFGSERQAKVQRGYAEPLDSDRKPVYFDGGTFPFKDMEFDYVICSHVLEHIHGSDLDLFISELQRVAPRGYIEFPNIFYELINFQDVHLWLMNLRENDILFLNKDIFVSNNVHMSMRELFYAKDGYMNNAFARYPDFFFCGYEWENNISYRIVENYDDLVSRYDLEQNIKYFSETEDHNINEIKYNKVLSFLRRGLAHAKNRVNYFFSNRKKYSISRTAVIAEKKLVIVKKNAEIQDYVIIKTYNNKVEIGEYTQINPFTVIYGGSGVIIGNNVMIAPHCMIAAGNHDFKQTELPVRFAGNITKGPIVIEDNVWIGANCTITDGVRIGRDAVVAANSVVTKDIAPYDIAGGVPARVIGSRK